MHLARRSVSITTLVGVHVCLIYVVLPEALGQRRSVFLKKLLDAWEIDRQHVEPCPVDRRNPDKVVWLEITAGGMFQRVYPPPDR